MRDERYKSDATVVDVCSPPCREMSGLSDFSETPARIYSVTSHGNSGISRTEQLVLLSTPYASSPIPVCTREPRFRNSPGLVIVHGHVHDH